ncbi:hypothetical protein DFS34DRAFT_591612 [Phlyctochytrium arcticum]|nr:hypothetical protein DFS34DRAFT_591612 [Phlyctochytrium arcticum]
MSITQFLNSSAKSYTADGKKVLECEKRGIFNKDVLVEIDEVKTRIQEAHNKLGKKSMADYLGLVRRVINKAGSQHFEIPEPNFTRLVKQYDESIKELHGGTARYTGQVHQSDSLNKDKYKNLIQEMLGKYEKVEYVYGKHMPNVYQIDELQTVIIGLIPVLFFNTRSNYMSLKTFLHKNTSMKSDNVFNCDNKLQATLYWNARLRGYLWDMHICTVTLRVYIGSYLGW